MTSPRNRLGISLFTQWERELDVEIEGNAMMRTLPIRGDTLFGHIFEACIDLVPHQIPGDMDQLVNHLEIKEFIPDKSYIRVSLHN